MDNDNNKEKLKEELRNEIREELKEELREELKNEEKKSTKRKNIMYFLIIGISFVVLLILFLEYPCLFVKESYIPTIDKPVIYLYPTEDTIVSTEVKTDLELTTIYPNFNKENKWTYNVAADGTIKDLSSNREYPYLYYESKGNIEYDLSKGFVVARENTKEFLEETLTKFGLNYKEQTDFITYWLPKLEKNNYNLIHFSENEYEKEVDLDISPKPDSVLRVFMVFKGLDKPIDNIIPQDIKSFNREGFSVVEWGGTEL